MFHHERTVIDDQSVAPDLASTDNWRLWQIDLEAQSGVPLEGLEWNAGAISTYHLGGRSFLLVPTDDWSQTHVFEIVDGRAEPRFDVTG